MAVKDLVETDVKIIKAAVELQIGYYDRQINTAKQNELIKETYRKMKDAAAATLQKLG